MAEEDLHIQNGLTIPGWELWTTTSRSSGAGGQHVNRTESRVTLHWAPGNSSVLSEGQQRRIMSRLASRMSTDGVLQTSAQAHRSQHRNREEARQQLADMIQKALKRRKRRIRTKPSRAAKRRRLNEKRQVGEKKKLRKNPKPPE